MMKKGLICLLAAMLFVGAALAEDFSLEGTVVATRSTAVLAASAGVVQDVLVQPGDRVAAGAEVASLMETITYAETSGVVTIFGASGEKTDTLVERYGAVAYIKPDVLYTVSASTKNAYEALKNKIITLGETVYIRSVNDVKRTGVGKVTSINGTSYTVEVTQGNLAVSDSVNIFRSSNYDASSRLGKGSATYCYPEAYTATGALSRILVKDGAYVRKGTPLFSTVDAAAAYGNRITSTVSGIVASLAVTPGTAVEAGALVATVYPDDALMVEILADEYDLRSLAVGQSVTVTFSNGVTAQGQVARISGLQYVPETTEADTEEEEEDDTAYFPVYVSFQTDAPIACGMTAKVTSAE